MLENFKHLKEKGAGKFEKEKKGAGKFEKEKKGARKFYRFKRKRHWKI